MDDIENYCYHHSRSQGMSDLRARRGNYYTVSILRGALSSSRTYVVTQIIWMHWMVYFDLIFRSMLIKDIVEDEGELWTEGSI